MFVDHSVDHRFLFVTTQTKRMWFCVLVGEEGSGLVPDVLGLDSSLGGVVEVVVGLLESVLHGLGVVGLGGRVDLTDAHAVGGSGGELTRDDIVGRVSFFFFFFQFPITKTKKRKEKRTKMEMMGKLTSSDVLAELDELRVDVGAVEDLESREGAVLHGTVGETSNDDGDHVVVKGHLLVKGVVFDDQKKKKKEEVKK